jgi:hypothetical protein
MESPSDGASFDANEKAMELPAVLEDRIGYGSAKRVHSTAPTGSRLFGGRGWTTQPCTHPIVVVRVCVLNGGGE